MGAWSVDMRLEIVVLPVSDVDRAKQFYVGLGWRLDADFVVDDDFRRSKSASASSGVMVGSPWSMAVDATLMRRHSHFKIVFA